MSTEPSKTTASGLLTDLYQITMAQGYWKNAMAEHEAVFHLTFRNVPFRGGFAVACGLEPAIDFLGRWGFSEEDLEYLGGLEGNDGKRLFHEGFLQYLAGLEFSGDVDAIPEGTPVFGHEPLLRIRGPLIQCQLLETPLLNLFNFQTLIATKAARITLAAGDDPVIEFGFRRSQGPDGSLAVARASYIGGCVGTSNVYAGKAFGVPVLGTHAHSWVMAFEDEREAFMRYANALPNNCVFLVDTYDSVNGVKHAIEAGKRLAEEGHSMVGVRLDSGDLVSLSIKARELLDEAGFNDAKVVASNELDEYRILELKQAGARIDMWGVGTRLATAYDQPALDGVYKLSAIRRGGGERWRYAIKLSEDEAKVPNPGIQQVRRFLDGDCPLVDVIYDVEDAPREPWRYQMPDAPGEEVDVPAAGRGTDLLESVINSGRVIRHREDARACRERAMRLVRALPERYRRLKSPDRFPVGLETSLAGLKRELISDVKKKRG